MYNSCSCVFDLCVPTGSSSFDLPDCPLIEDSRPCIERPHQRIGVRGCPHQGIGKFGHYDGSGHKHKLAPGSNQGGIRPFFLEAFGGVVYLLPRSLFLHCRSEADSVAAGKGRRAGAGFRVGTEQGRPHYPFLGLFTSSRKTSSQASEPEEFTSVSGTFFCGERKCQGGWREKKIAGKRCIGHCGSTTARYRYAYCRRQAEGTSRCEFE